jgi:hypothetical protein
MPKLLLTAVTLCGVAAPIPVLSQGFPQSLPNTNVPASTVYGEYSGGWLPALLRNEPQSRDNTDGTPPAS